MEISMKKVESSEYYKALLKQVKSPEVSNHIGLVLGSETQLLMVIYGIGSIESMENSRSQLSIAILMKKEFDWIDNNIQVFDPVLSATETSVRQSLGCTVLSVNEEARRKVVMPTLFYMPFCIYDLYDNLLQANLRMNSLSKMAIFGSSLSLSSFRHHLIQTTRLILAAGIITSEFAIHDTDDDYNAAFHNFSLHFFTTCN
ncbi:Protein SENSITIVITY TO RED LIGHT REDUCED 1 [Cardamine amara subsp. amara]|uniref:Protein SENSITIVITY TO RED LIGHT REDUCED 1 n=1 Tax=Cardamine amara subsp. amara TaxID=228776 RepID=A0ABD1AIQ4_CARAN